MLETKKESSYYDKIAGKAEVSTATASVPVNNETAITTPIDPDQPMQLRKRPDVLSGKTYRISTPLGRAYISINEDENGNIYEIFVNVGRAGSDITADAEAIGRLISLNFRIPSNYSPGQIAQKIISQLRGIGGSGSTGFGSDRVRSLADAIAKVLEKHLASKIVEEAEVEVSNDISQTTDAQAQAPTLWQAETEAKQEQKDLCPECGSASLRFIEGCRKCELCGFSKC